MIFLPIGFSTSDDTVEDEFKKAIQSLMTEGLIEYVIPGKPNSRLQKYRLTERGRSRLVHSEDGSG